MPTSIDSRTLAKISSDAHVDEPHDLWFERLPEHLRDRAPRRIQADDAGGWSLVVDGSPIGWSELTPEEADEQERQRIAAAAPEVRLDMMRTDGINGEIVYPTIGLYVWNIADAEVGEASCRIYNDWILERLGGEPRVKLAAMVPTWDLDVALAEVQRLAGIDSVGGILLPLVGTPEWNLPDWEPLWAGARRMWQARRDAPGHRSRHDLLPRAGAARRRTCSRRSRWHRAPPRC